MAALGRKHLLSRALQSRLTSIHLFSPSSAFNEYGVPPLPAKSRRVHDATRTSASRPLLPLVICADYGRCRLATGRWPNATP